MKLPSEIRIKRGVTYKVVWQEVIDNDPDTLGLCDPAEQTIRLKLGMGESETITTFIHECLHAASDEWEFDLPHKTVYALENAIFKILKLNRWI